MPDCLVRPAAFEDAPAIARVHIQAWQETYPGLVPQEFLDALPASYERRLRVWRERAGSKEWGPLVAEVAGAVVGFARFGPGRDPLLAPRGELEAIYVLRAHQGRGLGWRLLRDGFQRLHGLGFRAAYCWVVAGNPAVAFYERTGGALDGMSHRVEVGGRMMTRLACVWDDLALFLNRASRPAGPSSRP